MRGRKPKPTAAKDRDGSRQPRNGREPKPCQDTPRCPPHLDREAKAEWKRIVPELRAAGVLTIVDRAALAAYCAAWSRWVAAEKQIQKDGEIVQTPNGYPMQSPWLAISNRAWGHMTKALAEFGMTPSSRCRVAATPPISINDRASLLRLA